MEENLVSRAGASAPKTHLEQPRRIATSSFGINLLVIQELTTEAKMTSFPDSSLFNGSQQTENEKRQKSYAEIRREEKSRCESICNKVSEKICDALDEMYKNKLTKYSFPTEKLCTASDQPCTRQLIKNLESSHWKVKETFSSYGSRIDTINQTVHLHFDKDLELAPRDLSRHSIDKIYF